MTEDNEPKILRNTNYEVILAMLIDLYKFCVENKMFDHAAITLRIIHKLSLPVIYMPNKGETLDK